MGQRGFDFCNDNKPKWTIESTKNALMVRMTTGWGSQGSFRATAALLSTRDSCLPAGDPQGTTYA